MCEVHLDGLARKRAPLFDLGIRTQVDDGAQAQRAHGLDVGGRQAVQPIGAIQLVPPRDRAVASRIAAEVTEVVHGFELNQAPGIDEGVDETGFHGMHGIHRLVRLDVCSGELSMNMLGVLDEQPPASLLMNSKDLSGSSRAWLPSGLSNGYGRTRVRYREEDR